jgi:hypothetical protein
MVGEGCQGGSGHGVDGVGGDEFGYVHGVGIGVVLDAGGGPERALRPSSEPSQLLPSLAGSRVSGCGRPDVLSRAARGCSVSLCERGPWPLSGPVLSAPSAAARPPRPARPVRVGPVRREQGRRSGFPGVTLRTGG